MDLGTTDNCTAAPSDENTKYTADLSAKKKPASASNDEAVPPLEDELLSETDRMTIALNQRTDKLNGVHQSELDFHYTKKTEQQS
jgi:hypothetical protein